MSDLWTAMINLWRQIYDRVRRFPEILGGFIGAFILFACFHPVSGAVGAILTIFYALLAPVFRTPEPESAPAVERPGQPLRTDAGWVMGDGEIIDDDEFARRRLAAESITPPDLRDPAWAEAARVHLVPHVAAAQRYVEIKKWTRQAQARLTEVQLTLQRMGTRPSGVLEVNVPMDADEAEEMIMLWTASRARPIATYRNAERQALDADRLRQEFKTKVRQVKNAEKGLAELPEPARRLGEVMIRYGLTGQMPEGADLLALVPADTVLHLDRDFRLYCDCRAGHADAHLLLDAGVTPGRVTRECRHCAPATRWTERA